jgi:hypothetical protein
MMMHGTMNVKIISFISKIQSLICAYLDASLVQLALNNLSHPHSAPNSLSTAAVAAFSSK